MAQINNSFGSGGALNDSQFSLFIQQLKDSSGSLPIRSAATHIGMQDPHVCVLGEELQIDCNGELIPETERRVVWLNAAVSESMGNIRLYEVLLPKIVLPLRTADILERCCSDNDNNCS